MDRVIYIAMTGAREVTRQQAVVTHNLANVSTQGFKQQLSVFRALPVVGPGAKTRAYVMETTPRTDLSHGAMQPTGRPMDVAVHGAGWIAVQDAAGNEAYTRMGNLQVSLNGILQTTGGFNVLGEGAPIAVPPEQEVHIAKDGTVSSAPLGQGMNQITVNGRIKLVNPAETDLVRGDDGLFRQQNGQSAAADANVILASGTLEASNVNPAEALVNMVSLARQFEMNMQVLHYAEQNHQSADKVLSLTA